MSEKENGVATLSHNEFKDVLFNRKCLRNSMNTVQSKDHRIGTCEINKISLSSFDEKIPFPNNGYDGIAIGYQSYFNFSFYYMLIVNIA